jgi:hypothetical protein
MLTGENLFYLFLFVLILAAFAWKLLPQSVEVRTSMSPSGLTGTQVLVNGIRVVTGATYVTENGGLEGQVRVLIPHGSGLGTQVAQEIARELAATAMRNAVNATVPGSLNQPKSASRDYYSPLDVKL